MRVFSKNYLNRIADTCYSLLPIVFSLSVFSLIWRSGNFLADGFPKPFEILFAISFLLFILVVIFSSNRREIIIKLKQATGAYLILFLLLILFAIVGFWFSVQSFPSWADYSSEVYLEFSRIILSFLIFLLSTYLAIFYRKSIYWIIGAIALSPVVLFSAFIPRWQSFFVENSRLIGARNDPNYLASFLAIGLIVAGAYFLYTKSNHRWFSFIYIIFMSPFFLWAHSRGAFLSLGVALIVLSFIYFFQNHAFRRIIPIGILGMVFILSITLSSFVLPSAASRDITGDGFNYSRGSLWVDGVSMIAVSPLGFGPAYHNWNPVGNIGRPHNTFLEVALTSGFGGLFAWGSILYMLFFSLSKIIKRKDFIGTALTISFIYLLLNGLFLDMLTLRWFWLIAGMIVGYEFVNRNEESKSISNSSDA